MNASETRPFDGGCTCRYVRYRMSTTPLFVHCCHCRWCQRETGSAFALNALIEADRVQLLRGEVEVVDTPSASGKGQKISRCPKCRIAVWSHYAGAGPLVKFVRVGTLAIMQGGSAISKDLPPFTVARGHNGMCGLNTVGLRRAGFSPAQRLELKKLYRWGSVDWEPERWSA